MPRLLLIAAGQPVRSPAPALRKRTRERGEAAPAPQSAAELPALTQTREAQAVQVLRRGVLGPVYDAQILASATLQRGLHKPAAVLYFSLYAKDLELSRIFIREFLFHEGEVRKKLDEQTTRMLQMLKERIMVEIQAGRLDRALDSEQAAMHIYALYHATLSFALAGCKDGGLSSTAPSFFWNLLESSMRGFLAQRQETDSKQLAQEWIAAATIGLRDAQQFQQATSLSFFLGHPSLF